jgi:hypothetical protein
MFLKNLHKRVSEDREIGKTDAVIAITGDPGTGKSSLMMWFCALLSNKHDEWLDILDKNVLYVAKKEDVVEMMLTSLPPEEPIGIDEAIKKFWKHKWQSEDAQYFTQFFNICRKQRKIVILCIPRFKDLLEYFRNDRVQFRIYILRRGLAALFIRLPTPYGADGWQWEKVSRKWESFIRNKRPIPEETIAFFKKEDPTFAGVFEFPILPQEVEKEYEKRVDEHKYETADVEKKPEKLDVGTALVKYLHDKGMTQKEMGEITGKDQSTISDYLQRAIKFPRPGKL